MLKDIDYNRLTKESSFNVKTLYIVLLFFMIIIVGVIPLYNYSKLDVVADYVCPNANKQLVKKYETLKNRANLF